MHLLNVPAGAEGVPTVGVTVTSVVAATEGPLQPLAVTDTVAVPLKPALQVTVPVISILPAIPGLKDQLKPVLLVAAVV